MYEKQDSSYKEEINKSDSASSDSESNFTEIV